MVVKLLQCVSFLLAQITLLIGIQYIAYSYTILHNHFGPFTVLLHTHTCIQYRVGLNGVCRIGYIYYSKKDKILLQTITYCKVTKQL